MAEDAASHHPVMSCIWRIPICGGFCAPTRSPEKSCLRHFSNEGTVPTPCLVPYCCRVFWEHSRPVRAFGAVGFEWAHRWRRPIMLSAFLVSFTAWIFNIIAICAMLETNKGIRQFNWVSSKIDRGAVKVFLGLRKSSLVIGSSSEVKSLDGVCDTFKDENFQFYSRSLNDLVTVTGGYGRCDDCTDAAQGSVTLTIMGAITQIFQIATDLQRTTEYGDMNCQKAWGIITSMFGFLSTLNALKLFRKDCGLKSDWPPWKKTKRVTVRTSSGDRATVRVRVKPGFTFVLLFIATALKFYDVICHLIVPTPLAKRQKMDEPIEITEYMLLATKEPVTEQPNLEGEEAKPADITSVKPSNTEGKESTESQSGDV